MAGARGSSIIELIVPICPSLADYLSSFCTSLCTRVLSKLRQAAALAPETKEHLQSQTGESITNRSTARGFRVLDRGKVERSDALFATGSRISNETTTACDSIASMHLRPTTRRVAVDAGPVGSTKSNTESAALDPTPSPGSVTTITRRT